MCLYNLNLAVKSVMPQLFQTIQACRRSANVSRDGDEISRSSTRAIERLSTSLTDERDIHHERRGGRDGSAIDDIDPEPPCDRQSRASSIKKGSERCWVSPSETKA